MFAISHDGLFVYSLIEITEIKDFLKEETIEELMFIWANQTVIPYLNNLFRDEVSYWMQKKRDD